MLTREGVKWAKQSHYWKQHQRNSSSFPIWVCSQLKWHSSRFNSTLSSPAEVNSQSCGPLQYHEIIKYLKKLWSKKVMASVWKVLGIRMTVWRFSARNEQVLGNNLVLNVNVAFIDQTEDTRNSSVTLCIQMWGSASGGISGETFNMLGMLKLPTHMDGFLHPLGNI